MLTTSQQSSYSDGEDNFRSLIPLSRKTPPRRQRKETTAASRTRIISDNGPQFIARDFEEFIRISGMSHRRTIRNRTGKSNRWHKSLKSECIRPGTPLSLDDARRLVQHYVEHYNNGRLPSAIDYITPRDMLAGRQQEIQAERDRKLEAAREQRKNLRHVSRNA